MQISKQDLPSKVSHDLHQALCRLVADIRSSEEADVVLRELLSETERVAIMKRLGIAVLLHKHVSYEKIKKTIKVSSATIASIQEQMGRNGLVTAIEKVTVNELAEERADKIIRWLDILRPKKN
jgi:uncharacterized protein YerC